MEKRWYGILIPFFLLTLAGCTRQLHAETDLTPAEIASVILESQESDVQLHIITPQDTDFALWLTDYYLLSADVTDGAVCYADGVEASEIAVLLLADEADGEAAKEALDEYIQNRASLFEGYAPEQAAMAEKGIAVLNGSYLALLICQEPETALEAFEGCFDSGARESAALPESGSGDLSAENLSPDQEEPSSFEETDPAGSRAGTDYDSGAVLLAWQTGDDSSLSETDRLILEAAKNVIRQEITDDMTDYEKELAVHDWITGWSSFDYSVFGRSSEEGFAPGSDTPYGVLIDQSAMCHGYSSTFQLFMDMLDIECITVYGLPGSNGVEHSWNMVKLDGEWYCVDAAWDDPIGGRPGHRFFNVTSQYLRDSGIHSWDESAVPEADGTAWRYQD